MYHIIPDIHGQADKLNALLAALGWRQDPSGWRGPEPERRILFLGDFIDRGPENAKVLKTVRSLLDSGKAEAIMGNHEFNAIHFHTEVNGAPLRQRSAKNIKQHKSFLDEFPVGDEITREVIEWMKSLALFLENEHLRAVHACWYRSAINKVASELTDARLQDDMLHRNDWTTGPLWDALQIVTSGIEEPLPQGYSFLDKDGHERREIRIGWWLNNAHTWQDIARSVPDASSLPSDQLSARVADYIYTDRNPVFFGHYWLTGKPVVEAPHALCLDYSAGKSGPLVAYDFEPEQTEMDAHRIVVP